VRGVMANGKLARSVGDCGWYELRRQLTYKAKWYGRQLNIVPRFERTTGVCPDCGTVGNKLPLSVRAWTCEHCERRHDRDIAAA
jgi:putative transposase